ncbi:hypothetical protein GCM10011339_36240 [Echinicola rosea]|uniref:DUF3526 domain-containing protein n=2 Tax=Echinicola rosea TaxID=1807691 RepID=A0ABQ1VB81_9BACT|nr:hypothetical protein GCM10011339_36240 [Echinicola rosea]
MAVTVWVTLLGQWAADHKDRLHEHATAHMREQWDGMGDSNPHNAVHFGTYAFKPYGFLSSIDEGVQAVTGNVIRLEGHVQNEMAYSDASRSLAVSHFGKLKPALLLQYLVPLLLIFTAFSSISGEREAGRLRLLLVQGLSLPKIIFAKAIAIASLGWLLLTLMLAVFLMEQGPSMEQDEILRIVLLSISYSIFYAVLVLLTVCLSAWSKRSSASLSTIMALWVVWVICLPIVAGGISDELHPLPSRRTFKTAMEKDRHQGIDGHNPSGERRKAFTDSLLVAYGVDEASQLPINADGLIMQADEEYGNRVWDKHFGNNRSILEKQKKVRRLIAVLDPFMSLQHLSMAFCGNDLYHSQDFQVQAETYRRDIIKTMNEKHAYGGSKTGDWSWKASESFFQSIPEFAYDRPRITSVIDQYLIDMFNLLSWTILLVVLTVLYGPKLKFE